jgi:hypothetical protein
MCTIKAGDNKKCWLGITSRYSTTKLEKSKDLTEVIELSSLLPLTYANALTFSNCSTKSAALVIW